MDTRAEALSEAGDLLIPIDEGRISREHVQAELSELTTGQHPGRTSPSQITLFKSVGASLEDLAAAITCYEKFLKAQPSGTSV